MNFDPFGIHFGQLYLRYYGVILVSGAFLAGYLASLEAQRRGRNPELVWDGLIWAMVGGVVGARLWHVLTPPPSMTDVGLTTAYYFQHPLEILMVWKGGLGLPGAVAGGGLGIYLFARRMKLRFAEWMDIAAPAIPLGQAIGRWGNFINQELYGAPTTLPWGLLITDGPRVAGYTDPALRFHPAFLYEAIGTLALCLILLYAARRYAAWLKPGDLFLLYMSGYAVIRLAMEAIRLDSSQVLGLNANQALMLIVLVLAGGALVWQHRRIRRHQRRSVAG